MPRNNNESSGTIPIESSHRNRGACNDPVTSFEVILSCPRCNPQPPKIVPKVDPRLPVTEFCFECGHTWVVSRAVVSKGKPRVYQFKPRLCEICGLTYQPKSERQRICGTTKCRGRLNNKQYHERKKKQKPVLKPEL